MKGRKRVWKRIQEGAGEEEESFDLGLTWMLQNSRLRAQ